MRNPRPDMVNSSLDRRRSPVLCLGRRAARPCPGTPFAPGAHAVIAAGFNAPTEYNVSITATRHVDEFRHRIFKLPGGGQTRPERAATLGRSPGPPGKIRRVDRCGG